MQPHSFEALADVNGKQILKASKIIMRHIPPIEIHSYEYNKQFANKLKLSREVSEKMQLICKVIENWDIFNGHLPRPRTIAVAVIYLFSRKYPTEVPCDLNQIKTAGGISTDNTIKKYVQMLEDRFDFLVEKAASREDAKRTFNKVA